MKTFARARVNPLHVLLISWALVAAMPAFGQTGPVGNWKLDDGTGTTAADAAGTHTGSLINSPTWSSAGRVNGALGFNGPSAAVDVAGGGNLADLYLTGMSISAWIYPTSAGGGGKGRIADKTNWMLRMGSATTLEFISNQWATTPSQRTSTASITLNSWQHVVATWDGSINGSGIHIYVNGVLADGAAAAGAGAAGSDATLPLTIGNLEPGLTRGFAGSLDEVRIYNRVLTTSEIQALADSTPPGAPTSLSVSAVSGSQLNISWTAPTDNVAVVGYRLESCQGASCTNFAQVAAPTTTTYNNTGLAAATTYRYRVRATDANTNLGSYSSIVNGTTLSGGDTQAPTIPGTPSITAVSSSQLNLSWTASSDNVAVTGYLLERCPGTACTNFAQIATPSSASYSDTGLSASTTYRYRVRATDAATNTSTYSGIGTGTTQAGAPGPVAWWKFDEGTGTNPQDSSGNANHCTMSPAPSWTTGHTGGALNFDGVDDVVSCGSGSSISTLPAMTVSLWVNLASTGEGGVGRLLQKGDGADPAAGWRLVTQGTNQIEFAIDHASSDVDRITAPNTLLLNTWTLIVATWDGTTAATGMHIYVNGTESTYASTDDGVGTRNSDSAAVLRIGNRDGGTRTANGKIDDVRIYNRVITSTELQTLADSVAPSQPGTPTASTTSSSQINLSWSASTDNVVVTEYGIERCQGASCTTFTQIGTSAGNSYGDTGLAASTTYRYRIRAADANGNLSTYSGIGTLATSGGSDTQAPTPPTNLTATPTGGSNANLSWTASTDNVGVTGYQVERCTGSGCSSWSVIGTPVSASYMDTSLGPNTTYSYRVRASDAANNPSTYSNTALATFGAALGNSQSNASNPQSSPSNVSASFSGAQQAGATNVVVIGWHNTTAQVQSVTDTRGNEYFLAVGSTSIPGVATQAIYVATGIAAGTNQVTVTFTSAATLPDLRVAEYAGVDPLSPIDGIAAATGTGTVANSGSITTYSADDLLIGASMVTTATTGAGAGYTTRFLTNPNGNILEDRVVSVIGTYSATAPVSPSGQWIMQMVAFRWISTPPCN